MCGQWTNYRRNTNPARERTKPPHDGRRQDRPRHALPRPGDRGRSAAECRMRPCERRLPAGRPREGRWPR
jgi:hypothetical protein